MAEPLRPVRVRPGEELAHARAVMRQFHEDATEAQLERWLPMFQRSDYRGWDVRDGDEVVGTYGVKASSVSVPGGGRLPAAAVTAVGVAQTHRRRGLLRSMMDAALNEAVEHSEPVALLWASESAIYPRFGFGVVAPGVVHRLDRAPGFRDPLDPALVRSASLEHAEHDWPEIFECFRDQRGGALTRNEIQWRLEMLDDPLDERDGASGRRLVHVPGRGYAAYRVKPGGEPSTLPEGEVRVQELVATDPEAEAALWQHVCDIDLTTSVVAWMRPPDDAVSEMLVDPLRARTAMGPPLYARLLDVAAAFEARAYDVADQLTIAVEDPVRDQTGTYHLDAHHGGAEVRRVTASAQLTLPIEAAAAVWLGGVRATRLRAARRIVEHEPGAAARLDRLLAVERLPWTPFEF